MSSVEYPELILPASVERSTVTVWSNGVALDADLFRPRQIDGLVPGVVLAHGWGGSKQTGERYAARFAEGGMIALCFTQAGWGGSAAALLPGSGGGDPITLREVVDPIDWIQNFLSAADYLEGESGVDPRRIGAWGTSFGGGIALHCAANYGRFRALCVQVANLAPLSGPMGDMARRQSIASARGLNPSADGLVAIAGLPGRADVLKWTRHDPLAQLDRLTVPTLLIDASEDEMLQGGDNAARASAILRAKPGQVSRYEILPGINHYGIYFGGFERSSQLAADWFAEHL